MKLLYLDESGDHNLAKIDPHNPCFVLGGIIVDRTYARTVLRPRVRQFKTDFFGDPDIILHTNDIIRARNGFEELADPEVRQAFYEAINALMRDLDYQVVACVIDKPTLVEQYGKAAADPYHFSLRVLIERFCELVLKEKRLNIAGLQLADLVISPIARRAMGRSAHEDWEIVESKFRRSNTGWIPGYGLIELPKKAKNERPGPASQCLTSLGPRFAVPSAEPCGLLLE